MLRCFLFVLLLALPAALRAQSLRFILRDSTSRQPLIGASVGVPGTGVGMYLVQRILTSRGGHLEVDSTPGEGTTFTVHWATAQPEK